MVVLLYEVGILVSRFLCVLEYNWELGDVSIALVLQVVLGPSQCNDLTFDHSVDLWDLSAMESYDDSHVCCQAKGLARLSRKLESLSGKI